MKTVIVIDHEGNIDNNDLQNHMDNFTQGQNAIATVFTEYEPELNDANLPRLPEEAYVAGPDVAQDQQWAED